MDKISDIFDEDTKKKIIDEHNTTKSACSGSLGWYLTVYGKDDE